MQIRASSRKHASPVFFKPTSPPLPPRTLGPPPPPRKCAPAPPEPPTLMDKNRTALEGALLPGAMVEVLFKDGVWYLGRLVERSWDWEDDPPRWWVQFDDGELRNDIWLNDPIARVRFDKASFGAEVEVLFTDDVWYRGRLVELLRGSENWGVAFHDGDWLEGVSLSSPNVRYAFPGGDGSAKRVTFKRGTGMGVSFFQAEEEEEDSSESDAEIVVDREVPNRRTSLSIRMHLKYHPRALWRS